MQKKTEAVEAPPEKFDEFLGYFDAFDKKVLRLYNQ